MPIAALQPQEQKLIAKSHDLLGNKALLAGVSTAAASFLLIGALIVIGSGCLCLMLPGVNVITDIILPAVVPGVCAIISSLPFIVLAVLYSRETNQVREVMIDKMVQVLEDHDVPAMKDQKERVNFILHHLVDWRVREGKVEKNRRWTVDYQKKILNEIKEKMGKEEKDRNPRQKIIAKDLDKALYKLQKKAKK